MKKIVITGATGSIGRSLIRLCIDSGYEVLAIVHRSSKRASELKGMEHCSVWMLDLDEYEYALKDINTDIMKRADYDIFFHLAWMSTFGQERNNPELQMDNVKYALTAVRLAKAMGCQTFIGIGSQAEYGIVDGKLSHDTPTFPETAYGITKLCAGQLTRILCEQLGLRHVWCRVLSVYGPYDRAETLISTAVVKMLRNEDTEFTPCNQMWDYLYSDDAARAILLAALYGVNGGIYVIGSGNVRPLKEYIEQIASIVGYSKTIGFGRRTYNDNQVMYLQADISGLKALGFTPSVTFTEGIKKTIEWINKTQK